jgi:hypothetical protein
MDYEKIINYLDILSPRKLKNTLNGYGHELITKYEQGRVCMTQVSIKCLTQNTESKSEFVKYWCERLLVELNAGEDQKF